MSPYKELDTFGNVVICHTRTRLNSNDPSTMSPRDAARLTSYAQQQNPDILHQIMGPGGPLGSTGAKVAVAGSAALAAKQILGSGSFGGMRL